MDNFCYVFFNGKNKLYPILFYSYHRFVHNFVKPTSGYSFLSNLLDPYKFLLCQF